MTQLNGAQRRSLKPGHSRRPLADVTITRWASRRWVQIPCGSIYLAILHSDVHRRINMKERAVGDVSVRYRTYTISFAPSTDILFEFSRG